MSFNSDSSLTPVKVYCRIKPHHSSNGERCVNFLNSTQIELIPPTSKDSSYKDKPTIIANFTRVFPASDTQQSLFIEVGFPLIRKLINGQNGLMFAYGVTCSGKTHTLTGNAENPGIIPQAICTVYRSLSNYLLPKETIRIDQENNVVHDQRRSSICLIRDDIFPINMDVVGQWLVQDDATPVELMDDYSRYAIFISYIEIYNGKIYDLLSSNSKSYDRSLLKTIRDYSLGRSIFTDCEYQMNTLEEALSAYLHAQNFRKFEKTGLNKSSSRGHAIFTMRIVRLSDGVLVLSEHNVTVSQLSICDLAGSERARRANNEVDRQREANNINVSLSTLQKCIMTIRENQRLRKNKHNNGLKIVPYRDNILTSLFKHYFDGNGKIRMLVCLSPRGDEYDENAHVLKFSEMTKEVMPENTPQTSRTRHMNNRTPTSAATKRTKHLITDPTIDIPPCPPFILENYKNTELITNYAQYVKKCISLAKPIKQNLLDTLNALKDTIKNDYSKFNQIEKGNLSDHVQIGILTANLDAAKKQCELYQQKNYDYESEIRRMQLDLKKFKDNCTVLSHDNKRLQEEAQKMEADISKRYDLLYREKLSKYAVNMVDNIKKISQIRDITTGDDAPNRPMR